MWNGFVFSEQFTIGLFHSNLGFVVSCTLKINFSRSFWANDNYSCLGRWRLSQYAFSSILVALCKIQTFIKSYIIFVKNETSSKFLFFHCFRFHNFPQFSFLQRRIFIVENHPQNFKIPYFQYQFPKFLYQIFTDQNISKNSKKLFFHFLEKFPTKLF